MKIYFLTNNLVLARALLYSLASMKTPTSPAPRRGNLKHPALRAKKGKENPMSNKKGFTLIELMIVVAIIAILAMIAVPMYQRYIERARNSASQAILQQASIALVAYSVDKGNYPVAPISVGVVEELMTYGFRPDSNVGLQYATAGGGYVLYAVHKSSGSQVFVYDNINASGVQPMGTDTTTENGVTTAVKCDTPILLFHIDGSGHAATGDGASPTPKADITVTASGTPSKLLAQ
jgi:prepilin-type N-terminal cleavage/methylation domain-containing protein